MRQRSTLGKLIGIVS